MAKPTDKTHRKIASGDPAKEDHRVRVARERRERTRRLLLQSVLHVCSTLSPNDVASIDDVIRHADVARGTFYKYFASMEEAIGELALYLADENTASILPVYDCLEQPAMRTATGFQLFLIRALLQPRWAGFIARLGLLRGNSLFISKVHSDIELGMSTGAYRLSSMQMAGDFLMGAKTEAMLRIIESGGSLDYVCGTAELVLRAFGVPLEEAGQTAREALDRLCAEAPGAVTWWSPDAKLVATGPA